MHQKRKTIARVGRGKLAVRATRAVRAEITFYDHLIFVNVRDVLVRRPHSVSSLNTLPRLQRVSRASVLNFIRLNLTPLVVK